MNETKKTLVLGASDNPSRYSHLAIQRLRSNGHPVLAIGRKHAMVNNVIIETEKINFTGIHTVTLYLSPFHQKEYYKYILSLKPQRIIFNPGAENDELYELVIQNNITPVEACTLVMLSTGQY
jgi:predicted CoA-binding protein